MTSPAATSDRCSAATTTCRSPPVKPGRAEQRQLAPPLEHVARDHGDQSPDSRARARARRAPGTSRGTCSRRGGTPRAGARCPAASKPNGSSALLERARDGVAQLVARRRDRRAETSGSPAISGNICAERRVANQNLALQHRVRERRRRCGGGAAARCRRRSSITSPTARAARTAATSHRRSPARRRRRPPARAAATDSRARRRWRRASARTRNGAVSIDPSRHADDARPSSADTDSNNSHRRPAGAGGAISVTPAQRRAGRVVQAGSAPAFGRRQVVDDRQRGFGDQREAAGA